MLRNKYTEEIHNTVVALRRSKTPWTEVATIINLEYPGNLYNYNSIRKAYFYHIRAKDKKEEKDTLSDIVLEQIKDRFSKKVIKDNNVVKLSTVKQENISIEILFSDWQIGKLIDATVNPYNSEIALDRLKDYGFWLQYKILSYLNNPNYRIERIILASLGDIIESSKKTRLKSEAQTCDITTAVQISLAIEYIYEYLLMPIEDIIYEEGIPLEIIGITGNHDHDGQGMESFSPGREHFSYLIYKNLEILADKTGMTNCTFLIPDGSFLVRTYWPGKAILYEHGYKLQTRYQKHCDHIFLRERMTGEFIKYLRVGDKHSYINFNCGTSIVNGAFFTDRTGVEYSSIIGFYSIPCQAIVIYDSLGFVKDVEVKRFDV